MQVEKPAMEAAAWTRALSAAVSARSHRRRAGAGPERQTVVWVHGAAETEAEHPQLTGWAYDNA